MFEFSKRVFARRRGYDSRLAMQLPCPPQNQSEDFSGPYNFSALLDHSCRHAPSGEKIFQHKKRFRQLLEGISADNATDLLVSLSVQVEHFRDYRHSLAELHYALVDACFEYCMRQNLVAQPPHLPDLLTILTTHRQFREDFGKGWFDTMMRAIKAAMAQGAALTPIDREMLGAMARDLRLKADSRAGRKAEKRRLLARAEAIEGFAGIEITPDELLEARCKSADNPYALGELPENFDFWIRLLGQIHRGLNEIRLAAKAPAKPDWMSNPAGFAQSWPAIGKVSPQFGAWDDERPFVGISKDNHRGTGWAQQEDFIALGEARAIAVPLSRYRWNGAEIPALFVLADVEQAEWRNLAAHLIVTRQSPRPTLAWSKKARKLAQAAGLRQVETRLHDWLETFHAPSLSQRMLAMALNGHRADAMARSFSCRHPAWPERYCGQEEALGRAIAMVIATGPAESNPLAPLGPDLLRYVDHMYKGKSCTQGALALRAFVKNPANGQTLYESALSWLCLSVENEQFMRGAVWLLALMPDRARAIKALEKIALNAATRLSMGQDGHVSKAIAHAAIATLTGFDNEESHAAILRLSCAIEDQAMSKPLHMALAGNNSPAGR